MRRAFEHILLDAYCESEIFTFKPVTELIEDNGENWTTIFQNNDLLFGVIFRFDKVFLLDVVYFLHGRNSVSATALRGVICEIRNGT